MLPSHGELLEGFAWHCRAHRVDMTDRQREGAEIAILGARRVAGTLATDPTSIPAAVLFGLSLHARELGPTWRGFGLLVLQNLTARTLGSSIELDDAAAIELHRLRLLAARDREAFERASDGERRAMFEPMRAFVASRMR